jgi:hypothetical protein
VRLGVGLEAQPVAVVAARRVRHDAGGTSGRSRHCVYTAAEGIPDGEEGCTGLVFTGCGSGVHSGGGCCCWSSVWCVCVHHLQLVAPQQWRSCGDVARGRLRRRRRTPRLLK